MMLEIRVLFLLMASTGMSRSNQNIKDKAPKAITKK